MSFSDNLKAKAGPLPVWAWGAILGIIVIGGVYWFRSRSAASSAEPVTTTAYPELSGDSALTAGSSVTNPDGTDGSSDVPDFSSNLAWETYAMAKLIGMGYSPLTVQAALENYLHGEALIPEHQAIVNLAIARFGMPPNGTTGVSVPAVGNDTVTKPGVSTPVTVASKTTTAKADTYTSAGFGTSTGTTTITGTTYSNGSTSVDRNLGVSPQVAAAGGTISTKWVTVHVNGVPIYVSYRNGRIDGNPYLGRSAATVSAMKAQLTALGLPTELS